MRQGALALVRVVALASSAGARSWARRGSPSRPSGSPPPSPASQVELPAYVDYVKTGSFKEYSPLDGDWYYLRAGTFDGR